MNQSARRHKKFESGERNRSKRNKNLDTGASSSNISNANFRSPKFSKYPSNRKLPFEETLDYSSAAHSKSYAYLSPVLSAKAASKKGKESSRVRSRKNSSKMGNSPSTDSIFERLYKEKDTKKLKREALKEEYEIREAEQMQRHRRSRSSKKELSPSPDNFYEKQMQKKVEADKRIVFKMYEKLHKYETELQKEREKRRSRSRKRSNASQREEEIKDVHDRLFNDVRERSRKRMQFEMDQSNKHYESAGNISLSSLGNHNRKRSRGGEKDSHVPKINRKSKKMATPKREQGTSINSALYKDAEVRRARKRAERKKSKDREKEKIKKSKHGTLKSSKKMLIKKYLIEFDEVAQKLGVMEEPEAQIHFTQFIILMQKLNFVAEDNEADLDRLKMIWSIIQDQESSDDNGHYCRKHSLKVVLAAI